MAARRSRWAGWLIRAGGALIVLGSVLPWVWVPVFGLRVPWPGVLGWGALTLLLGFLLARRPPLWLGLPAGLGALVVGGMARADLPAAVKRGLLAMEGRLQPLDDLLAHFGIAPLQVFDFGASWAQLRGPGPALVLAGAVLALLGASLEAAAGFSSGLLRRCRACGHVHPSGRMVAFCVRCGAPMPAERACPACHTLAEPGDLFCARCGESLAPIAP